MTNEEWNQLRPDDLIQLKGTDICYKVHALADETLDVEQDALENDILVLVWSRSLWIDPLLPPEDPYYPDITLYEPGEADRFDRVTEGMLEHAKNEYGQLLYEKGQPIWRQQKENK